MAVSFIRFRFPIAVRLRDSVDKSRNGYRNKRTKSKSISNVSAAKMLQRCPRPWPIATTCSTPGDTSQPIPGVRTLTKRIVLLVKAEVDSLRDRSHSTAHAVLISASLRRKSTLGVVEVNFEFSEGAFADLGENMT